MKKLIPFMMLSCLFLLVSCEKPETSKSGSILIRCIPADTNALLEGDNVTIWKFEYEMPDWHKINISADLYERGNDKPHTIAVIETQTGEEGEMSMAIAVIPATEGRKEDVSVELRLDGSRTKGHMLHNPFSGNTGHTAKTGTLKMEPGTEVFLVVIASRRDGQYVDTDELEDMKDTNDATLVLKLHIWD